MLNTLLRLRLIAVQLDRSSAESDMPQFQDPRIIVQQRTAVTNRPKKLLDQMADRMRIQHLSLKTERSYIEWVRRFILFHNKRHPKEMGGSEVAEFLSHLAV